MKFNDAEYFKHKDCLDTFIQVKLVTLDSGQSAIVWAYWLTQGTASYWYCDEPRRYFIKEDHYDNWQPYTPKGNLL